MCIGQSAELIWCYTRVAMNMMWKMETQGPLHVWYHWVDPLVQFCENISKLWWWEEKERDQATTPPEWRARGLMSFILLSFGSRTWTKDLLHGKVCTLSLVPQPCIWYGEWGRTQRACVLVRNVKMLCLILSNNKKCSFGNNCMPPS